jgi:ferric-dicitrate binding protein FerR (iron transport regulator)
MPELPWKDEDEFIALVLRYLEGVTSPEEDARLETELKRPENGTYRERFVALSRQQGQLREMLSVKKATRPSRWVRWKLGLIAAAAVLIGMAGILLVTREGPARVAVVEKVEGKVTRQEGDRAVAVTLGEPLPEGASLKTGSPGTAVLRYEDGSRVELRPETHVRELGTTGGKRLFLARGTLRVDAAQQPPQSPMVVRTAEGEARVVGTRFTLLARTGSTRLEVERGVVRLTRQSDHKTVDVTGGQFAVASPKEDLVARTLRPTGPGLVASMAPNTWAAIPETVMSQVAPDPGAFPEIQGGMGVDGVIEAWSGGALDTKRRELLVWGGGHSNYFGNEVYAFNLDSLAWRRVTEPTPHPNLNEDLNPDGSPNARATYNGLAYIAHADRLFSFGGSIAGNGFASCRITWVLNLETRKWQNRAPAGLVPPPELGCTSAYDPQTRTVWWGQSSGLYSYDYDQNRWTQHNEDSFYYFTSAIDLKRGLWVVMGNGKVFAYPVRSGKVVRESWKTTGGEVLIKVSNPGFDYDPVRDRLVGWAGGAVYTLDPERKAWTVSDAPGAPASSRNGIYGRFRYVPSLDAFVAVTSASKDVHLYKPGR